MSDSSPSKHQGAFWIDQIVRDPDSVSKFYAEVAGLTREGVPEDDVHTSYAMKNDAGQEVLGICDEAVFSNWVQGWVPYIEIADFEQRVAKIDLSGGTIVQRMQMDYNWKGQRFCLARDPSGAPVMLCEAKSSTGGATL